MSKQKILNYLQNRIDWLEYEIKRKKEIIEICSLEEDKEMWRMRYIQEYEYEINLLMTIHKIVQRYFIIEEKYYGTITKEYIKEVNNNE